MKLYAGKTYVCRNGKTVTLENDEDKESGMPVFSCRENDYLYGKDNNDDAPCVLSTDVKHPWDIVCELMAG